MPAVTYWQALETMSEHGDDIIQWLDDEYYNEVWDIPEEYHYWAGLACYFCSLAVELWASSVEEEIEEAISEREDRLVEWSLSDDGTMDTVISVTCRWCGESFDVRYDCEMAADYRDETGALDCQMFADDVLYNDEPQCPKCGESA